MRIRVVNEEHGHVALPKLYGAPAYARPAVTPVARADRPFDPDELPLEAAQTVEERELAQQLASRPYTGLVQSLPASGDREGAPLLRGRPFRLGAITGRLRGTGNSSGNGTGNGTGA
jgi:hypothetical protein